MSSLIGVSSLLPVFKFMKNHLEYVFALDGIYNHLEYLMKVQSPGFCGCNDPAASCNRTAIPRLIVRLPAIGNVEEPSIVCYGGNLEDR